MRIALYATVALASATAKYCDPTKWKAVIYNDQNCKSENQTMTMQNMKQMKSQYHLYSGKCEISDPKNNIYGRAECTENGFKMWSFYDKDCSKMLPEKEGGMFEMKWGECAYDKNVSP